MGLDEEETAGRCAAILSNGKRCPNASIPGSRYCGLPAHQALTDTDNDYVTGEPPAVEEEELEAGDEPEAEAVVDGDGDGAAPEVAAAEAAEPAGDQS